MTPEQFELFKIAFFRKSFEEQCESIAGASSWHDLTSEQKINLLATSVSIFFEGPLITNIAYKKPSLLMRCFAGLSRDQRFELLKIQDKNGWTALIMVARNESGIDNSHIDQGLALCFHALSADQKFELLKIQNKYGWTALIMAADFHPESLAICLEGLSVDQRFELLKIQNKDGSTALMIVAHFHPESVAICLEGLSVDKKFELLKIQDENGWTALMMAARYHPESVAICLEGLSVDKKFELLKIQNKSGWTELMMVARNQSGIENPHIGQRLALSFHALSADQKFELLKIQNKYGWTALMMVARNQSGIDNPHIGQRLALCFQGLSADQKFELLRMQNEYGWTALNFIAFYVSECLMICVESLTLSQCVKLFSINSETDFNQHLLLMLSSREEVLSKETILQLKPKLNSLIDAFSKLKDEEKAVVKRGLLNEKSSLHQFLRDGSGHVYSDSKRSESTVMMDGEAVSRVHTETFFVGPLKIFSEGTGIALGLHLDLPFSADGKGLEMSFFGAKTRPQPQESPSETPAMAGAGCGAGSG